MVSEPDAVTRCSRVLLKAAGGAGVARDPIDLLGLYPRARASDGDTLSLTDRRCGIALLQIDVTPGLTNRLLAGTVRCVLLERRR